MEPFNLNARAEALRWLDIAEKLLSTRDIVGSKTFAARARESDPRLEHADQILAIADTLLAGGNQISNHHLDWYAILQLARRTHDSELIGAQYRRLALLLNPNRNKFPFAEHAFKLVSEAWLVLSNPSRKFLFDNEIGNSNTHFNFIQQHHEPQQVGNGTHFNFIQEHHEPQQVGNGTHFNFIQEHCEPQQLNNSTHFNFIQEHREQHHQSLPLQQQQQLLSPFPQQQTLPQQQSQALNLQQLHETTIASPTSTLSAQQPLPRPHPQQPLDWSQPHPPLSQPHLLPQQFLPRPQPQQPSPQPQPRQPSPQPQPRQPSTQPQPQPQPRQPSPQPQPRQPSPQPQPRQPSPQPQPHQPSPQPQPRQPSPQPQPRQPSPQPQPRQPSPQPQPRQLSPQPQPPSPQPQPQQLSPQPQPQPQPQPPSVQPQPEQTSAQPQHQSQVELPWSQPQERGKSGNPRKDNSNLTEEEGGNNDNYVKNDPNGKKSSNFWTACPYCYNMYEYNRAYAECTLRCQNCKRAFHAVIIADPPLILEGKDVSFCCWVNFPFGVSMSYLEKNKKRGSNWTPFSTMFACPLGENGANIGRQKNARKSSGPRIYIDDDREVFVTLSSSDDSDDEWSSTREKKKAKSGKEQGQELSHEFFSRRRQT